MDTDSYVDIAMRRERVNKHSVRYTARDCTESATTPCPTVTLPQSLVDELGLSGTDDVHVRVSRTEWTSATERGAGVSEALREKLESIPDLSDASPLFEELLLETEPELAEAIGSETLARERKRTRLREHLREQLNALNWHRAGATPDCPRDSTEAEAEPLREHSE